jgi:hypothetical protein
VIGIKEIGILVPEDDAGVPEGSSKYFMSTIPKLDFRNKA